MCGVGSRIEALTCLITRAARAYSTMRGTQSNLLSPVTPQYRCNAVSYMEYRWIGGLRAIALAVCERALVHIHRHARAHDASVHGKGAYCGEIRDVWPGLPRNH